MGFTLLLNQLKRTFSVKRCADCNYYYIPKPLLPGSEYKNSKCMRFAIFDMKTRLAEFESAYLARGDKTMCGPDGKHFEKHTPYPPLPHSTK